MRLRFFNEKARASYPLGAAIAGACLLLCGQPALGHDTQHMHHAKRAACEGRSLNGASAATATFAPDGSLWLVWGAGGYVSVAKSNDLSQTFSTPVAVNAAPLELDLGA